jgi:hypothetical protein
MLIFEVVICVFDLFKMLDDLLSISNFTLCELSATESRSRQNDSEPVTPANDPTFNK